jgi:hypothetical protein
MASPTLLAAHDRSRITERLRRLTPDAPAGWGTLDAPRMVCHVADQLRVALGEIPAKPVHTFASRTLLKFLVLRVGIKPPRGKVQTAPEMLLSQPGAWEEDVSTCIDLVERVGRGTATAVHPTLGPLSPRDWGRLCWKHLDHHLVQFGV